MVSTRLDFSIDSPTPGTRIGLAQGIRARGIAHVTNVGLPTFTIFRVDVRFGPGGQFIEADIRNPVIS